MSSEKINRHTIDRVLSDEQDVHTATAPYQAEFPYEQDEEANVTRREFCNFLFLTSSALFVSSGGFAAKLAYSSGSDAGHPALKIEGAEALGLRESINFRYPGDNDTAILVRAGDGKLYAYEQKCTHLTCPVYYSRSNDRLECPCHEGGFDVHTGSVLYGPPPRPLRRIELDVLSNQEAWAVGIARNEENE
jgi:Rieske Fe-S protein